jgi:hypothetical protein
MDSPEDGRSSWAAKLCGGRHRLASGDPAGRLDQEIAQQVAHAHDVVAGGVLRAKAVRQRLCHE